MKKLLKSEVCESHKQCTGPTGVHSPLLILLGEQCTDKKVKNCGLKKKKWEQQMQNVLLFSYPNHTLTILSAQYSNILFISWAMLFENNTHCQAQIKAHLRPNCNFFSIVNS